MADFRIENHGSIVLVYPESDDARDWVDAHIPFEAMRWGGAVVVEPRYVAAIVEGAQEDGLEVAGAH